LTLGIKAAVLVLVYVNHPGLFVVLAPYPMRNIIKTGISVEIIESQLVTVDIVTDRQLTIGPNLFDHTRLEVEIALNKCIGVHPWLIVLGIFVAVTVILALFLSFILPSIIFFNDYRLIFV